MATQGELKDNGNNLLEVIKEARCTKELNGT
jgi:hypothetical protein